MERHASALALRGDTILHSERHSQQTPILLRQNRGEQGCPNSLATRASAVPTSKTTLTSSENNVGICELRPPLKLRPLLPHQ